MKDKNLIDDAKENVEELLEEVRFTYEKRELIKKSYENMFSDRKRAISDINSSLKLEESKVKDLENLKIKEMEHLQYLDKKNKFLEKLLFLQDY